MKPFSSVNQNMHRTDFFSYVTILFNSGFFQRMIPLSSIKIDSTDTAQKYGLELLYVLWLMR